MRQSLETFIETCFKIKVHLQVASYELYDYEDGDYAEFKTRKIRDLKSLLKIAGQHEVRIYAEDSQVVVAVYEDFKEYK